MKRRSFFGGVAAMLGFAPAGTAAVAGCGAARFDPTVPPGFDGRGSPVCRVYRESEDERTGRWVWLEIQLGEIRPGDRIIRIGQDGPRLWVADAFTVTEIVPPHAPWATIGTKAAGEVDLRVNPAEVAPLDYRRTSAHGAETITPVYPAPVGSASPVEGR